MAKKVRTHYGLLDFTKPFPKSYKFVRITGWIGLAIGLALCVKEVLFGSSGEMDTFPGFLILYGITIQIAVSYSHLVWKIGSSRYKKAMEKQEPQLKQAEALILGLMKHPRRRKSGKHGQRRQRTSWSRICRSISFWNSSAASNCASV